MSKQQEGNMNTMLAGPAFIAGQYARWIANGKLVRVSPRWSEIKILGTAKWVYDLLDPGTGRVLLFAAEASELETM